MPQGVEYLLPKHEALSSRPSTKEEKKGKGREGGREKGRKEKNVISLICGSSEPNTVLTKFSIRI
jgi:hypothetical protein